MYVMSVRQQRVAVEFVGKAEVEERQGHLENLKVATLTYAGVRSAGPQGQLRAACPSTLLTFIYFENYSRSHNSFPLACLDILAKLKEKTCVSMLKACTQFYRFFCCAAQGD